MSTFVEKVRALIIARDVHISEHGYDELAEDGLSVREVLGGVGYSLSPGSGTVG